MFTGIVEEIGIVTSISQSEKSSRLRISAKKVLEGTKIGDSIMVQGVCLTVAKMDAQMFEADVMAETMTRTGFQKLSSQTRVNLERALTLETRLGGHIDGIGTIQHYRAEENAVWVTIEAKSDLLKYVIEKGSIAIDGISLTVASVNDQNFSVSIIPHTASETTLLSHNVGYKVNLECDLIGKYVEKLLNLSDKKTIDQSVVTKNSLLNAGFI
ncbi:riboflavin synthase [Marinilactibacillus kalidii]|uniref:riboflavin synthase n=1 Tax=Marinilactibacillus kalidii TaxID=2820274 RepID=UPI001ABEBFF6|nr:riboflavin synthase [Marinilactibacillus kalidii]